MAETESAAGRLPDTLAETNILVIGLGLMGGSLALALKNHCSSIAGFDPNPEACQLAESMGCVERSSQNIDEVLSGINLIVLAAPVRDNLAWLDYLARIQRHPTAVIDLSSTKTHICYRMASLPEFYYPIGGHPMCGKATAGIQHAVADLYKNAVFALVKPRPSSQLAMPLVLELVASLQAVPLWIDADVHDAWVASTSHLPYLLANALAFVTPPAAFPLVGPGFRSSARLASSSLPMIQDILRTNRLAILEASTAFREHFASLQHMLEAEDYSRLAEMLQAGADRQQFLFESQATITQTQA